MDRAGVITAIAVAIALTSTSARAQQPSPPSGPSELSLDLGGATLDLRRVPKGAYTQGSPATEPGREVDEAQRPVSITRDFWMGKFPVTRGQFARFVGETRYVTEAEKGQSGGIGWDGRQLGQRKDFTWRAPGFAQTDGDPVVLVTFG